MLYIGKIFRNVKIHHSGHLNSFVNNEADSNYANHLNLHHHNVETTFDILHAESGK